MSFYTDNEMTDLRGAGHPVCTHSHTPPTDVVNHNQSVPQPGYQTSLNMEMKGCERKREGKKRGETLGLQDFSVCVNHSFHSPLVHN